MKINPVDPVWPNEALASHKDDLVELEGALLGPAATKTTISKMNKNNTG